MDCPASECERRDVKGIHQQARSGALHGFTGVSDPYEAPLAPEIRLHTDLESVGECLARLLIELDALSYGATNGLFESGAIPVGVVAKRAVG